MAGLTQTLESIPGIGPIYAAGIIAEIGQIERFDDETKSPSMLGYIGVHISLVGSPLKILHYLVMGIITCGIT